MHCDDFGTALVALTYTSDTARERLALLDSSTLRNESFDWIALVDDGAPLFRALCTPRSAKITTLNLFGRNFIELHAPLLCRALEHMPALLELDLSRSNDNRLSQAKSDLFPGTELGDDGLATIASAFRCLRNLRALSLSGRNNVQQYIH